MKQGIDCKGKEWKEIPLKTGMKNYAYPYFGGEEKFIITQENDNLKNQYAKNHNIPLIRIPYNYKNKITLSLLFNNDNLIIK